jgi:8-oxo-dGTP pyrophosphatase MutT (NUDIX family)
MTYSVWFENSWHNVDVPEMGGESLVVPNVAAIVLSEDTRTLLLQRRDKPGEPVRGKLEVPGGRWRAGESPAEAVIREVREETGIELIGGVPDTGRVDIAENRACGFAHPVTVVNGLDGIYPSLHVVFQCLGSGNPRPQPGETSEPRWWPRDDVKTLLAEDPDVFVDQTRAILTVYFGVVG